MASLSAIPVQECMFEVAFRGKYNILKKKTFNLLFRHNCKGPPMPRQAGLRADPVLQLHQDVTEDAPVLDADSVLNFGQDDMEPIHHLNHDEADHLLSLDHSEPEHHLSQDLGLEDNVPSHGHEDPGVDRDVEAENRVTPLQLSLHRRVTPLRINVSNHLTAQVSPLRIHRSRFHSSFRDSFNEVDPPRVSPLRLSRIQNEDSFEVVQHEQSQEADYIKAEYF